MSRSRASFAATTRGQTVTGDSYKLDGEEGESVDWIKVWLQEQSWSTQWSNDCAARVASGRGVEVDNGRLELVECVGELVDWYVLHRGTEWLQDGTEVTGATGSTCERTSCSTTLIGGDNSEEMVASRGRLAEVVSALYFLFTRVACSEDESSREFSHIKCLSSD